MKNKKKSFSFVLALCICCLFYCSAASANETGTCGVGLTWDLRNEVLTILGTGEMTDYSTSTPAPWYTNRAAIESLVIENSVTSIGKYAFYGCENLSTVTIPDSLTSIGVRAFSNCANLTMIRIPDSVTDIGNNAFENCNANLTIKAGPDSVAKAYAENNNIQFILFMSGTCGENLTWTLDAQDGCVRISGLGDMTNYTSDNKAPWLSSGITIRTVIVNKGVKSIGDNAFDSYLNSKSKITSVQLPEGLERIGKNAFRYCDLTSLTIPESVVSIGDYAFISNDRITSITIPNSITTIGKYAFSYIDSLISIKLSENINRIESGTFTHCYSLTEIVIPDCVTYIGPYAFSGCTSLTKINIPKDVTSISQGMFEGCTSLTTFVVPDNINSIGYNAFNGCSSMSTITIPESVTSIYDNAFDDCPDSMRIKGKAGSAAETFANNHNFQFVAIQAGTCGETLKWVLDEGVLTITGSGLMEDYASNSKLAPWYEYRSSIRTVIMQEGVANIGSSAFLNCSNITKVTIPGSICRIGEDAFCSCNKLESITIPESVTEIEDYAFRNCWKLTIVSSWNATARTYAIDNDFPWQHDQHKPISIPAIAASCTKTGLTEGSNCKECEAIITAQTEIPPLGHLWAVPVYTWAEDNSSVTAIQICDRDNTHLNAETVSSYKKVTLSPTETTDGTYAFISQAFTLKAFDEQRKDGLTIPALGSLHVLKLPQSLSVIRDSAFASSRCQAIIFPLGCTKIGADAFAGCDNVIYVQAPSALKETLLNSFNNNTIIFDWIDEH